MDDFLTAMYAEEQEKVASVELESFMDTLPASELEEFLGLSKLGVAGPADPELPSEESGKLSKEQKKTEAVVTKMQEKRSQGFGDEGMGDGMETTASIKADIAMRAMRVTRGAPPHIKLAAARFAGNEMAKTAGIGSDMRKNMRAFKHRMRVASGGTPSLATSDFVKRSPNLLGARTNRAATLAGRVQGKAHRLKRRVIGVANNAIRGLKRG